MSNKLYLIVSIGLNILILRGIYGGHKQQIMTNRHCHLYSSVTKAPFKWPDINNNNNTTKSIVANGRQQSTQDLRNTQQHLSSRKLTYGIERKKRSFLPQQWRNPFPDTIGSMREWWLNITNNYANNWNNYTTAKSPTISMIDSISNQTSLKSLLQTTTAPIAIHKEFDTIDLPHLMLSDEQIARILPYYSPNKSVILLARCGMTFAYINYLLTGTGDTKQDSIEINKWSDSLFSSNATINSSLMGHIIKPINTRNGDKQNRQFLVPATSILGQDDSITQLVSVNYQSHNQIVNGTDSSRRRVNNDQAHETLTKRSMADVQIVDCYLVDIAKRPDEMSAFENHFDRFSYNISLEAMVGLMSECSQSQLINSNRSVTNPTQVYNNSNNASVVESHEKGQIRLRQPRKAINATNETALADSLHQSLTQMQTILGGIAPGTLWCGRGDRATNFRQLGKEAEIDACCREHDHCPIRLKPFTYYYGLNDWSVYTRSHCKCERVLDDCLIRLDSSLAQLIRRIYLRFVGTHCLETRRPV